MSEGFAQARAVAQPARRRFLRQLGVTLAAGLGIATLRSQPATAQEFICPPEDIAETGCQGPKDCHYPHPKNCNQFIHCEVNADGVSGRPTVKDCPANLQWNDNKKECDYPAQSTCPG